MKSDVLVVGAGPAGLATAIGAALKGLRVTVADARRPPINKPCGEGLLPEAVQALHSIGIELNSSLGFPLEGFRFSDDSHSVSAPIRRERAFGLRRTVLHNLLVARAVGVGVNFLWGTRISDLASTGARINGELVGYRWLVGADGLNSVVRRWAKFNWPRTNCRTRFGFRRHFAITPWSKFVEVYWGSKFQMVVTPTHAEDVCVSFFSRDPKLRINDGLLEFREVARRLENAHGTTPEQGSLVGLTSSWRVASERVALVGDASCSVDGIAGHGLSLGLQQARALADALSRGDVRSYRSAHRKIVSMPLRMTRLLLLMDASGWVRRKALRLLESQPDLFARIISVHTSKPQDGTFDAKEMFDLSWRVLRA
jgi:2-polyprenyl-6-methoxyphenol hydroxylase-like FAD-dependent oxidoreductase